MKLSTQYATIALAVASLLIAELVIHVLHSIPGASQILQLLGLYFTLRYLLFAQNRTIVYNDLQQIATQIIPTNQTTSQTETIQTPTSQTETTQTLTSQTETTQTLTSQTETIQTPTSQPEPAPKKTATSRSLSKKTAAKRSKKLEQFVEPNATTPPQFLDVLVPQL